MAKKNSKFDSKNTQPQTKPTGNPPPEPDPVPATVLASDEKETDVVEIRGVTCPCDRKCRDVPIVDSHTKDRGYVKRRCGMCGKIFKSTEFRK